LPFASGVVPVEPPFRLSSHVKLFFVCLLGADHRGTVVLGVVPNLDVLFGHVLATSTDEDLLRADIDLQKSRGSASEA
jgi:hypothetical protein